MKPSLALPARALPSLALITPLVCIPAGELFAHSGEVVTPSELWTQWDFDPAVVIPLVLATGFYTRGLHRLWRRAGAGRGISIAQASAYFSGTAVLVVALISPLDAAASALFSLHMVQHLLLILVAAPLLVVGAADIAFLWSLPIHRRKNFGRFEHGIGRQLMGEAGSGVPLAVVLLATATLWLWHIPALYDLAVRVEAVHIAEHAAFLATAVLFWITVLRLRPRDHLRNGSRLFYVFGMAMQGSMLGALITFAARPLYQSHIDTVSAWGLTALVDQQLAGLIMWVPPALLYLGVIAYLFVRWLQAAGVRQDRMDSRSTGPSQSPLKRRTLEGR